MIELVASSGLDAQNKLAELVKTVKQANPFRHITLVVESNHQGLQFRRQLIRSLERVGARNALVAFSAVTKTELLTKLAAASSINWDSEQFEKVRQGSLVRVLQSKGEDFKKLAQHPDSLEKILSYTRGFDWLELSQETVSEVISDSSNLQTKVSQDLLQIAFETQVVMRELGQKSPAEICKQVMNLEDEVLRVKFASMLGLVVSLVSSYPLALKNLVSKFSNEQDHVRLVLQSLASEAPESLTVSSPSPEVEAKAVVRAIAKRISEGSPVDQMAFLYSDSAQYADIIAHELDAAEITWHGIATETPLATRVAGASKNFFEIVVSIQTKGTFSRAELFSLFKAGSLRMSDNEMNSSRLERFVKRNGFFNDIKSWIPQLKAIENQIEPLTAELQVLSLNQADQEQLDGLEFKIRNSREAAALLALVRDITDSAQSIFESPTEFELASRFWAELNNLCPGLAAAKMPMEKLAFTKFEELYTTQPEAKLDNASNALGRLIGIQQNVLLKLSTLRMQHGEQSRGVYVGPITQNGSLFFNDLWIVGAGDGYLPPVVNEDPIFPDSIKRRLGEVTGEIFPSIAGRVHEIEQNFFAVASGAKNLTVSYSRAGTMIRNEGNASAWINRLNPAKESKIEASKEFRLQTNHAVAREDLKSKESAAHAASTDFVSQGLRSAIWFASPSPSSFVGDLSEISSSPLIDFSKAVLSASYVERFLKCQHNFFTVRLLGVSDMEEDDDIEEVRAIDFGKSVHKAFERLLNDWPELNPTFGEPYSLEARDKFIEIFSDECDLLMARGQAGWAPLFNARKRGFIDLVPKYFEIEHEARSTTLITGEDGKSSSQQMSSGDQLRPKLAEFPFGDQGQAFVPIVVSTDSSSPQTLRFKGIMDRVDSSENGEHYAVMDFKTGTKSRFETKAAVQDLLYESVIRSSKEFVGLKKVSTKYIFVARRSDGSGVLEIRGNRNRNIFLSEAEGGLVGKPYQDALEGNRQNAEEELNQLLSKLVEASLSGQFITHNTTTFAKSFEYCSTCNKLGKKRIKQLSGLLHTKVPQSSEDEIDAED